MCILIPQMTSYIIPQIEIERTCLHKSNNFDIWAFWSLQYFDIQLLGRDSKQARWSLFMIAWRSLRRYLVGKERHLGSDNKETLLSYIHQVIVRWCMYFICNSWIKLRVFITWIRDSRTKFVFYGHYFLVIWLWTMIQSLNPLLFCDGLITVMFGRIHINVTKIILIFRKVSGTYLRRECINDTIQQKLSALFRTDSWFF